MRTMDFYFGILPPKRQRVVAKMFRSNVARPAEPRSYDFRRPCVCLLTPRCLRRLFLLESEAPSVPLPGARLLEDVRPIALLERKAPAVQRGRLHMRRIGGTVQEHANREEETATNVGADSHRTVAL